jgi:hypothetical protein
VCKKWVVAYFKVLAKNMFSRYRMKPWNTFTGLRMSDESGRIWNGMVLTYLKKGTLSPFLKRG